jgi:hypothetical protein
MCGRLKLILVAIALSAGSAPAGAHDLTLNECMEGSDFIKNAALSRDYGITREEFIERMRSDILAIQSFPRELRWFVQDEQDEALLIAHAERVFDEPRAPESHQSEFLEVCVSRITAEAEPEPAALNEALLKLLGATP